jgi:hypothetical protein
MADLEPRVRQLEEDVGILKGEIKSVLMEVRTTLLSQNNPFTASAFGASAPAPAPSAPAASAPAFGSNGPVFAGGAPSFGSNGPSFGNAPSFGGGAPAFGGSGPSFDGPPSFDTGAPVFQPQQEPSRNESFHEESRSNDKPQQIQSHVTNAQFAPPPGTQPAEPAQQPVPLPVAPRRSWELNTLAMLLAWCQSNMVRLSDKEMTSLLSLARYGGLVDEELAGILLEISASFDQGKDGRAATVSEYLLALHELHSVIKDEEEPPANRLRRVS